MIGFSCELLNITEINMKTSTVKKRRREGSRFESESEANLSMGIDESFGRDDKTNFETPKKVGSSESEMNSDNKMLKESCIKRVELKIGA